MSTAGPTDSPRATPSTADQAETQLEALVEEFHARLRRGEEPDLYSYQEAYPHLAVQLEERLLAVEKLHELAAGSTTPPVPAEVSAESLPASLGRYALRRVLGRGATAIVYEAYDSLLRRTVALKVLCSDGTNSVALTARFARDARMTARLRHPHIVPMHETGVADGRLYIDMELVDGVSLEQHLRERPDQPWDIRDAAQLVWKMAVALAYAHRQGILHRDVKPSNILIDRQGEPQLADFGLARELAGVTVLTAHNDILGTPAYMSPEQAAGRAHQADARSDVYSLGVVFYRLLTGQMPFPDATLFEVMACAAHNEVPSPRALNPTVPRDLEIICRKALEREAADRFRTAQEFADELWRWLRDEPLRLRRPTPWARVRRWLRRNRAVATVLAVAAVLLVGVGGSLGWGMWRQSERAYVAQQLADQEARLRAEVNIQHLLIKAQRRLRQPSKGRRWETQAILSEIKEYRRLLESGEVRDDLDLQARSLFAASLGVPDVKTVAEMNFPNRRFRVGPAVIHPDGGSIVLATPDGPVRWVHGSSVNLLRPFGFREPFPRLVYSPNGKYLVYALATGGLQVWDETITRKMADLPPENGSPVLGMGFDRAGTTLWTCRTNGRVEAWSLPDCQAKASNNWTISTKGKISAAAFDRTATRLAVGDHDGRVLLAQTDGKRQHFLQGASTDITVLAWSPDGRSVAAGCHTGDVHVWDVVSGRPLLIPVFNGEIDTLLFHPCGQWLMAGRCWSGSAKLFDVVTGQLVLEDLGPIYAFSADGRHFVGRSSGVTFGEFHSPNALRRLVGHRLIVDQLAWSRDNRHLVSLDGRFEIRVWDLAGDEPVAVFQQRSTDFYASNAAIALSDDARLLAYASGGESSAKALIQDVATGAIRSTWPLKGGFECIACTGGENFLLVREELDDNGATTQTVAYELSPGRPLSQRRVIRTTEPGDVRRFFEHGLSADGRYHWWTGPRFTPRNRRVEVHDVKTGARLCRILRPADDEADEICALLSPDGRHLWYGNYPKTATRCDIDRPGAPTARTWMPLALALDKKWSITGIPFSNGSLLLGRGWLGKKPWLVFADREGYMYRCPSTCFSPNGRYLAWGDDRGTVCIADLNRLEKQVQAFAEDVLPE